MNPRNDGVLGNNSDAAGLRTFFTLDDIEFHFGSFVEVGAASIIGVHEHVFTTVVGCNESKAFACVEKLDCTFLHFINPLKKLT